MRPSLDGDSHMMMIFMKDIMWYNISSGYGHIAFRVYEHYTVTACPRPSN